MGRSRRDRRKQLFGRRSIQTAPDLLEPTKTVGLDADAGDADIEAVPHAGPVPGRQPGGPYGTRPGTAGVVALLGVPLCHRPLADRTSTAPIGSLSWMSSPPVSGRTSRTKRAPRSG